MQLSFAEAEQRSAKLRETISDLAYRYYVLDDPKVSDAVYDSLISELRDIERQFPELKTPDSPTQRVGGEPLDRFRKVAHRVPMLSLADVSSSEEVEQWYKRISKLNVAVLKSDFYCELKVDGVACSLIYQNGILVRASTRGDGYMGEDITQNVRTISAIPLRLRKETESEIEVRGEIYMPYKSFISLNKEREKAGQALFANPRNAAAGAVRQLDPKLTAERNLSFIAYQLIKKDSPQLHSNEHQELEDLGFKANSSVNIIANSLDDIFKFHDKINKQRTSLDYQIDGIVVQLNDRKLFNLLGVVGKDPRGAVAYKFEPEEATTKLLDIILQVGRQGTLTPVAVLEPVNVAGVTVSRASLHNEDEIKRKDIRIGDTVVVRRAGDVIPEVVRVIEQLRDGSEKKFHFPKKCQACGANVVRAAGEAAYRCDNTSCYGSKLLQLHHFATKAAFDMPGLGAKVIDKLYDAGLIRDPADLFYLKPSDISSLPGFAVKSAENIVSSIQKSRSVELNRFIYGLGIRYVGQETALTLAREFKTVNNLRNAKLEDLQGAEDIGPVVAKSIYNYFSSETNRDFVDKLLKVVSIKEVSPTGSGPLKGVSIIFTGTLDSISRFEAQQMARSAGADVSESISKNTNILVVGSNPGSKVAKAEKLGVRIMDEREFIKLLN